MGGFYDEDTGYRRHCGRDIGRLLKNENIIMDEVEVKSSSLSIFN